MATTFTLTDDENERLLASVAQPPSKDNQEFLERLVKESPTFPFGMVWAKFSRKGEKPEEIAEAT